ncbi:MAG: hypothetical protein N2484_13360 [Clostridia bacterium]|nr:hypothetical protein [Clostridia bacterium]
MAEDRTYGCGIELIGFVSSLSFYSSYACYARISSMALNTTAKVDT